MGWNSITAGVLSFFQWHLAAVAECMHATVTATKQNNKVHVLYSRIVDNIHK